VTFSLKAFAAHGGPGGPVDGWGVAYHDGRDARIYREPEPARESKWLTFVEGQQVPSTLQISHIRHATQGAVSLSNTQPFARELGGRVHLFAHNGRLPGLIAENRSARFNPLGDTDSEIAFIILLERLADAWIGSSVPSLATRMAIFGRFASDMRRLGPANFLYTDGDALFVHGHRRTRVDGSIAAPGLWRLHRHCPVDADSVHGPGISIERTKGPQDILLFASVPLTEETWLPLEEGETFAVRNGSIIDPSRAESRVLLGAD
jgi:glutamine amidotransferase